MTMTTGEQLAKNLLERDELFASPNDEKIWLKYCGFLDLSLGEFMSIQRALLMEQINLIINSMIGRRLMRGQSPASIDEFRRAVPLTSYDDYEPCLSQKNEQVLPVKPVIWAHTSGRTGFFKWAPYSLEQLARLADDTLAAFILSAAGSKGEVRVRGGEKVLLNLPPVPYITGIMASAVAQRILFQAIPPLEKAQEMDFHERISRGFVMALNSDVDFAASIAAVLAKVGESFGQMGRTSLPRVSSLRPGAALRILRAIIRAKLAKRSPLPRDIWTMRGLVCGGTDTSIYRAQIAHYWGVEPLDAYAATETGFIAMQAWDKSTMTFTPYSNFYEFIPEDELARCQRHSGYQPSTVLMDEVEKGKTYELVITNFYGGPFLRYRMGDLITIVALSNKKIAVGLPQMVFRARADEIIDLSGFARLDERTIWSAIQSASLPYQDWSARKEYLDGKPMLHIYLELGRDGLHNGDIAPLIDRELIRLDQNYRDLRNMTGSQPVLVTLLKRGTFERYAKRKQAAGFDLSHMKPPHMNAADAIIRDLLQV